MEFEAHELEIQTWPPLPDGGLLFGMNDGVRVRHIPTGVVVVCNEHRHQYQNKDEALSLLESHLAAC